MLKPLIRFSGSDSYQQTGSTVELDDVTIEDAGYYYCTAEGPDGTRKTASIQVKVRDTGHLPMCLSYKF